ncbi:MAG: carboxypeptidase-like regulatory domain-containing protein [Sphingobacteriaceae bacterium]|nr:carboxypeptidase-like regulatory domain-containing protein [Sphingobacteriaceae bacterium]
MMRFMLVVVLLLGGTAAGAQDSLRGFVFEETATGRLQPLMAANVVWLGTTVGTSADAKGYFALPAHPDTRQLVISYIGHEPDTLFIRTFETVKVVLKSGSKISTVEVQAERAGTFVSSLNPIKTQVMTEKELFKAACCNLSESFETNPAVDVSYTDAVTGVKQIQMLGLSGNYIQMQRENLPDIRGLAANYGLTFVPGSWIESIQVVRGIGSVVNGYESIAGQINLELKKPDQGDFYFINGYQNQMGRSELNWYSRHQVNRRWSTALLAHGNLTNLKNDVNKDGFLDLPLGSQLNLHNRWKYDDGKGVSAQLGVAALTDERLGGQVDFESDRAPELQPTLYGSSMRVNRAEVYGKLGYVFPQERYRSVGLMANAVQQQMNAFFGDRNYTGFQQSFYSNLIYQDILGNTNRKYRAGLSLMAERYDERFVDRAPARASDTQYERTELVPGAFYELTVSQARYQLVGGLRADYHNLYGGMLTPRLHGKYDFTDKTALRLALGRGYRVANVFAENMGGLVSSREVVIQGTHPSGFGLEMERAWNAGLSLTHDFKFRYREASVNIDVHHTTFENQVVVDYDFSPRQLLFYNLQGRSYSNSAQIEVVLQPARRFDVKMAYRYLDVKTQYQTGLLSKPLIARDRVFLNMAYATRSKWSFDYTVQWIGTKRLPGTTQNPEAFRFPERSPSYFLMNGQISKAWKRFDFYVGIENMADFRQTQLVNAADQPFSQYFDASMVWGPGIERMVYVGFRFRIQPVVE